MIKEYAIICGNSLLTNVANLDEQLDNYTQEKGDTSIVFHAIDVKKRDSFSELVVMCYDTDVLLLLLHYFEMISSSAIFKTTEHEYILRKTHKNLTPDICKALLGIHVLSGCDQTGKYPGYSKMPFWIVFVTVPNEVLEALTNLGSSDTGSVADIKPLELFILQFCTVDTRSLQISKIWQF